MKWNGVEFCSYGSHHQYQGWVYFRSPGNLHCCIYIYLSKVYPFLVLVILLLFSGNCFVLPFFFSFFFLWLIGLICILCVSTIMVLFREESQ